LRLGVLGGAFNPPHIGHLVCAQEALVKLELELVLFIPTGTPPHRELEDDPGEEARVEMCELATAGDERFEVSRAEVDREGPSYTADTLAELREERPDDELFLIVGGDRAASLPEWHEPERVLELAQVCAFERTGVHREAIAVKIARLKGAARVRFLDMPTIQVSSSMVRRRVARGSPIRYLVPEKVGEYIEEKGLYAAERVGSG
jgi:nicotinate-nucleotide adenylyltransferase